MGSFFRWLTDHGVVTVDAITYAPFEDYMAESKWASPATAHRFCCMCRKLFRWCKTRGLVPQDRTDFTGDVRAPATPRGKPKAITRDERVPTL